VAGARAAVAAPRGGRGGRWLAARPSALCRLSGCCGRARAIRRRSAARPRSGRPRPRRVAGGLAERAGPSPEPWGAAWVAPLLRGAPARPPRLPIVDGGVGLGRGRGTGRESRRPGRQNGRPPPTRRRGDELRSGEAADEPRHGGRRRAAPADPAAELGVVADDEDPGSTTGGRADRRHLGASGPGGPHLRVGRPTGGLDDEADDEVVGGPIEGVVDAQPRADPSAEAGGGRLVEDEVDGDGGRYDGPQAADERGRRDGSAAATEGVDDVRPVDDEPLDAGQPIRRPAGLRLGGRIGSGRRPRSSSRHAPHRRIPPGYDGRVLLLVDLDGVVYRASRPVPGVAAVLARRAAAGDDVLYVTNNSMSDRRAYVARLRALGAPVDAGRVVTSASATARYLRAEAPDVRRVLALGAGGLVRELRAVELEVVPAARAATALRRGATDGWRAAGCPEAVVVGLDPRLTYLRLAAAADAIRAGARFVATNRDPLFPMEEGLRPGAGAIVAALEAASGRSPIVIGKPAGRLLELAAAAVGRSAAEAVVVGDSLATDLPAARAVGARMVLMLTGVTRPDQVEALPPEGRPDAVAADAEALAAALDALAVGAAAP
jgi:HAD superfamily hydrolase (TIGR01450 family)